MDHEEERTTSILKLINHRSTMLNEHIIDYAGSELHLGSLIYPGKVNFTLPLSKTSHLIFVV